MADETGPGSAGYRALHSGLGAWTDPERVLLRVEGPRAPQVLGGLLSTDVASMAAGDAGLSFILNAKGRPLAMPRVLRLDSAFVLDVSRAALPGLLDHFSVYLPPRFAAVTELEGGTRCSLIGPRWSEAAARLGLGEHRPGAVRETNLGVDGMPVLAAFRDAEDGGGIDLYAWHGRAAPALSALAIDLGATPVVESDHEVWRIEQGSPRYGIDVTTDNLPQETGLVGRAVDFRKGCYTGQEVVARIHYRGHVNRHLRGLSAAEGETARPLPPGSDVYDGTRPMARVTSSCTSPRLGPIALAYVRREAEPGARLSPTPDGPPEWTVRELPFTSR